MTVKGLGKSRAFGRSRGHKGGVELILMDETFESGDEEARNEAAFPAAHTRADYLVQVYFHFESCCCSFFFSTLMGRVGADWVGS